MESTASGMRTVELFNPMSSIMLAGNMSSVESFVMSESSVYTTSIEPMELFCNLLYTVEGYTKSILRATHEEYGSFGRLEIYRAI